MLIRRGTSHSNATPSELADLATTRNWHTIAIVFVVCMVAGIQTVYRPGGFPTATSLVMLALYALSCLAIGPLIYIDAHWVIAAAVATNLFLGLVLSLGQTVLLGALTFELLAMAVLYRLPARWTAPIIAIMVVLFLGTQYRYFFLVTHMRNASENFWKTVIPFMIIPTIAVALRSRALIIQRLRATQAQLEAEMERTAELAVARERTRIARDMHDVLAHSLTVLSIQAQAAREIVMTQPERTAAMLDDIVDVLRQSLAESRRLVGVLREAERAGGDEAQLGEELLTLADRFSQRTGVRCSLTESGEARPPSAAQRNALRFALQEALTNAYRHGQARHIWATLEWNREEVSLRVRDNGSASNAAAGEGGGQGLRGMRERAAALGGTSSAGPSDEGGFVVIVTLPLAADEANTLAKDA